MHWMRRYDRRVPPSTAGLPRSFFARPAVEVAPALLGKVLQHGPQSGRIAEVEAYLGEHDPAAHAARGLTPRTKVLYGPPGHAYVYLIYGMYECLNVSCEPEGSPGCVLIRALDWVSGPGRLTRAMGISRAQNGVDLTFGDLIIRDAPPPRRFDITPRIGIRQAADWPLRFVVAEW